MPSAARSRQLLRVSDHRRGVEICDRTPVVQHQRSGQKVASALLIARQSRGTGEIAERLLDDARREVPTRRSFPVDSDGLVG
jgi:hypothetical protein